MRLRLIVVMIVGTFLDAYADEPISESEQSGLTSAASQSHKALIVTKMK